MKVKTVRRGQIAVSQQGHDRGQWYVVLEIKEHNVLLVDGKLHPFEKPKKKNEKHIQLLPFNVDLDAGSPYGGETKNSDVRKFIQKNMLEYCHELKNLNGRVDWINHGEESALVQE